MVTWQIINNPAMDLIIKDGDEFRRDGGPWQPFIHAAGYPLSYFVGNGPWHRVTIRRIAS